ncbi:MAG: DUF5906 domain-containing protein [Flavobacterium sp.]|nr:DUF5906 domain-containing protein [Flavobacterium sp.]
METNINEEIENVKSNDTNTSIDGVFNTELMLDGMLFLTKKDLKDYVEYKTYFNNNCYVVNCSGTPALAVKTNSNDGEHLEFKTIPNATTYYNNKHFNIVDTSRGIPKKINKEFFPLWLRSKSTKRYDRIVFEPNKSKVSPTDFNLWKGFIQPKKGDIKPFIKYLNNLIVGSNDDVKKIIQLLAWTVQNPGKIAENCIALRGKQGAGKSSLGMVIKAICPEHTQTFKDFGFMSSWNDHTKAIKYFLMEESVWGGETSKEGLLKDFLTGKTRDIQTKFFSQYTIPNYSFAIFTSNEDWLAPVGKGDRRFNVFDTKEDKKGDHIYWEEFYNWLNGDGKHFIMDFLLNLDLSKFKVRETVMNDAKADTQALTFRGIDKFVHSLLNNDIALFDDDGSHIDTSQWETQEVKIDRHLIINTVEKLLGKNNVSPHAISSGLNKIFKFEENWKSRWKRSDGRYFYKFPSKKECMELFAKHTDIPVKNLFSDCVVEAPEPPTPPSKPTGSKVATAPMVQAINEKSRVEVVSKKQEEWLNKVEPKESQVWELDGKKFTFKPAYDKALREKQKSIEQLQGE